MSQSTAHYALHLCLDILAQSGSTNVMFHLAEYHANWGTNDPTLPKIPGQLLVDSFITSEEESLIHQENQEKTYYH
jgi:hypothetical protein